MSDQAERDKILQRVKNMLNLANPENGGTQGEIENAARMAKALMDKYNIEMLEVMREKKDDPMTFTSQVTSFSVSKLKQWHWSLARAINRIVGTKSYSQGDWGKSEREKGNKKVGNFRLQRMCFFGAAENVKIACDLFDKWCVRIDSMASEAVRVYIKDLTEEFAEEMLDQGVKQVRHLRGLGDRSPQTWRTSWNDGCLSGIHSAITQEEEAREDEERKAQGKRPLSGLSWRDALKIKQQEEREEEARKVAGALPVGNQTTALALASYAEIVQEKYDEFAMMKGMRSLKTQASRNTNYDAFGKGREVGSKIRLNSKELK
jgi:hypothetical protein